MEVANSKKKRAFLDQTKDHTFKKASSKVQVAEKASHITTLMVIHYRVYLKVTKVTKLTHN